jgi:predicted permease
MRLFSEGIERLRALLFRHRAERELDEEMSFHIGRETEENIRNGLPPEAAHRQALLSFGGVERFKEGVRDERGTRPLEELASDLRFAFRSLRRSPVFTITAVLVLGLGLGASTAVFSAVDAVLLARLPYHEDDRLIRIYEQNSPTNRFGASVADFRAIQTLQRRLKAVGVVRGREVPVSAGAEPTRARVGWATSGFFEALAIDPARGRLIGPADDVPGAASVVVLSDAYAARTFGFGARAIGRTVTIDGTAHTVVGVLRPGVRDLAGIRADLWPVLQLRPPERRGPFGHVVIARLADGATLADARAELAGISRRIFAEWSAGFQDSTALLTPVPLREVIQQNAGQTLRLFAAAVALVLLVAIANVASLMLVRALGRWREMTLRTVLGASRGRLARLLVTESLVLAGAGAMVGWVIAVLALRLFTASGGGLPRLEEARLDPRAAAFAAGIALLAGLGVGVSPVILLLRRDPGAVLRAGERAVGAGKGAQALRGAFVVAEFALTLPLLAAAGLLLKSVVHLQQVHPGFDPKPVLAVHVSLPSASYPNDSAIAGFWTRALARAREVPGVVFAGIGTAMPPDDPSDENNFDLIDHPVPPGTAQPVAPWSQVTSDYFATLGVPLLDGRQFAAGDSIGSPPVVIVSRAWAQRYFPEGSAIGRLLISGGCVTCPRTTVVGVVGDVKYEGLSGDGTAVYDPMTQGWPRDANLFLRTSGPAAAVLEPVRTAVQSVDPAVPLDDAASMEDRLRSSLAAPRHWTALLGGFAAAALGLATVGIFGMLSFTVAARQKEIGMRMALGARPGAVIGMIIWRGMAYALGGAALGLAVTVLGTRWLGNALFDVSATDPATLSLMTLILLMVALIACWMPARRAAAIDPIEALRTD